MKFKKCQNGKKLILLCLTLFRPWKPKKLQNKLIMISRTPRAGSVNPVHRYLIFHYWPYLWADFALILNLYRDITISPYYGYVGDWVDSMRGSWTPWLTVWRYTAVKNDHLRSIYERPTWRILAELGNKATCQSPSVRWNRNFTIVHLECTHNLEQYFKNYCHELTYTVVIQCPHGTGSLIIRGISWHGRDSMWMKNLSCDSICVF